MCKRILARLRQRRNGRKAQQENTLAGYPNETGGRARRGRVDLVHLVSLVQPNKRDRPDKQERPAGPRTSLATVHRRWRIISASCQAYLS